MSESSSSSTGGFSRKRSRLALPDGFRLGRYLIGDQLGAGGFGITYRAQDTQLNRLVAIKELLPTSIATRANRIDVEAHTEAEEGDWEWAQNRFIQEAETVAACEHPNVLQVYEVFKANGTVYMATRFEEGSNLEDWYRNLGRAPQEQELRSLLLPLLSALERVHSRGFLHRDIKPDNIYMAKDGRPVLIDFGSARQKITHKSLPLTKIVTPAYAPFEQYLDDGHQGPFTDLYSMGAVLYRGITGRKPPEAPQRSVPSMADQCIRLAQAFSRDYEKVFLQCIDAALAPEPRDRPQTAREWLTRIGAPVSAAISPPPRLGGRSNSQAVTARGIKAVPERQPNVNLTLTSLHPHPARPPVRLMAGECFRVGRDRLLVDYLAWFWPRTEQEDARTLRLGRVHVELVEKMGRLMVEARQAGNGTALGAAPLRDGVSREIVERAILLLADDYQLEVTPFHSQAGGMANAFLGAVRFAPLNSSFVEARPVWILRDALFGSHASNPIVLEEPGVADVQGRIYYREQQFWVEAFAQKGQVALDEQVLPPQRLFSLRGVRRLRVGESLFELSPSGGV